MEPVKLSWGKNPPLVFKDINEYYRALGHLTNDRAYSISYEYNKKNGSFSDACRIRILNNARNIPQAFENKRTTAGRINCKDYVENLKKYGFIQKGNVFLRNFHDVYLTIPQEYISDFLKGYGESTEETTNKEIHYTAEVINTTGKFLKQGKQPSKISNKFGSEKVVKIGKRDYITQYIKDLEIGEAGERLVYEYECNIIECEKKRGSIDKNISVKWISQDDNAAGYDILSYDIQTNKEKYIEVKTTSGKKSTPFYVSENELNFSKTNSEKYFIYRVYGLKNNDSSSVGFYIINGDIEKQENFELSIKDYLVKLKSQK